MKGGDSPRQDGGESAYQAEKQINPNSEYIPANQSHSEPPNTDNGSNHSGYKDSRNRPEPKEKKHYCSKS
jgi:hypothetical protein